MKIALSGTIAVILASFVWAGCSSADDSTVASSGQDLSGSGSAAGSTGASNDPTGAAAPNQPAGPPTPKPGPTPIKCPPGEKICRLGAPPGTTPNASGAVNRCVDVCVPMGAMCVAPECGPVCDPSGPPPRKFCSWDATTCKWECPVCDPPPPPKQGCQWDPTACVWLCL